LSAPYKKGQNGNVERHIGMIYDLVRTYMLASKAPQNLIEFAMRHAINVLNCCQVPRMMNMTPEQAWSGENPSMQNFHLFFQRGAAFNSPKERKRKLDPKAKIVHYLGIAPNYKDAFICYNPKD